MGIESSASLLSTQIVNIVHENNPDARGSELEKLEKSHEAIDNAGKDNSSIFRESDASTGSYEETETSETYNENGYLNKTGENADVKNQKSYSVDLLV